MRVELFMAIGLVATLGCHVGPTSRPRDANPVVAAPFSSNAEAELEFFTLGSTPDCPPELHPNAGYGFGRCDRDRSAPRPVCGDPLANKMESWHPDGDCGGWYAAVEKLIGKRRVGHCLPVPTFGMCRTCQQGTYGPPRTPEDDVMTRQNAWLFFSLDKGTSMDGLEIENEDIIAFDGVYFARWFDGSDVGIRDPKIDAFAILNDNQILISFSEKFRVSKKNPLPGLSGDVDGSDIVLFTATSLGEVTRGTFGMYFDGSDVGLEEDEENIDALAVTSDGRLIISTSGKAKVPGAEANPQDLLQFTPQSVGPDTIGTWEVFLDGGDVDLDRSSEDIDAVALGLDNDLLLSTSGSFISAPATGGASDVAVLQVTKFGSDTEGKFLSALLFDRRQFRLETNNVAGIEIRSVAPTGH